MPKQRSWTDDDLIEAFHNNQTIRGIILDLNLAVAGGSYGSIKRRMKKLGLKFDTTWQERRDNAVKNHRYNRQYDDADVFSENTTASPTLVRTRFEQLNEQICSVCSVSDWNDKPLKLDLDHIDGNRKNNQIENLRWLCPNCHRQTNTWGNTGA